MTIFFEDFKSIIIFALGGLILTVFAAKARDLDTSAIRMKAQDAGLIFMIQPSPGLSINDYEGGAGFIYYLLNDVALRGSVGVNYEHSDEPATVESKPNAVMNQTGVSFLTGLRFNLISNLSMIAYSGFEGLLYYSSTSKEHMNHSSFEPKIEEDAYGLGGGIFIGAEWFFVKNLSLSLEYKLRYTKTWSKETTILETNTYSKESATVSKVELGGKNINLMLTFYFN